MMRYIAFFFVLLCTETSGSRIRIENNAYKGILIALPENSEEEERPRIVQSVENLLRTSSVLLQMSTKGRAYFSEVSFIIPNNWNILDTDEKWKSTSFNSTDFSDPQAALTVSEADVVVTDKGQIPYVLHQAGCGRRAMRIILPKDFLLRNEKRGVEFTRLWSEYRYGVFPEGGFQNDEKYPLTYRSPNGNEDKITGCSDKTFWSSSLCNKDDKQCALNSMTSSMMDQHLSSSASLFCEGYVSLGPRHNTESPSKHNLLCKEEGTLFTVMKSPDFAHGKNAAPRYLRHATDVSFRFVREAVSPKVIVAIEISSRMLPEQRYVLTQAAFYHFIYSTLPYDSEVTLFVFGDEDGAKMVKDATILKSEDSRILYVESQPLPEETSITENVSLSRLFDEMFKSSEEANSTKTPSSTIIIVTTKSHIDASTYTKVKRKISETKSQLHIMIFPEGENSDGSSLTDLCAETGGEVISLQADALRDLYRGFGKSIGHFNKEIQITHAYLEEETDDDLEVSFVIDESLTENLKVFLFFPYSDANHLHYRKTILQTPSGSVLNFMKLEFLFAWAIDLTKPEAGVYVLKTRRVEDVTYPVLISVTGRASTSEDPVTVNSWAETLSHIQVTPRPVKIYAEVKKGWNPIGGADVMATVHHPDGKISELALLDDGLGDVDITKNDGIFGRYFTNFTAPGSYNLYVKVSQGTNVTAEVMKGPNDFCCGSFFPTVTKYSIGSFQREAGPFTFQVPYFEESAHQDGYPPSRITDLTLYARYDRICVLHWTAVGDDYDAGSANIYELKVFHDAAAIRNRFSGSGQEIFSETIESPREATYGTTLNHAFELPFNIRGGVYYIAVRAIDDVGNAGEPSNSVPVWVEESSSRAVEFDCESEGNSCNGECKTNPFAEKLQGNSANSIISGVMTLTFIPAYIFVIILTF